MRDCGNCNCIGESGCHKGKSGGHRELTLIDMAYCVTRRVRGKEKKRERNE